jgi:hypothetical protein
VALWEKKRRGRFSHEENEETKILKGFRPLRAPSRSSWLCGRRKEEEGFSHEENEETKVLKGFRRLRVPSRSSWLCGRRKEEEGFRTKKTKRQRFSKDLDVFVPLRVLCDFVGRKRERRFSHEENEETKILKGFRLLRAPSRSS